MPASKIICSVIISIAWCPKIWQNRRSVFSYPVKKIDDISNESSKILVIGCVSNDTLHLEHLKPKQTHYTAGGAGLYTALAANIAGAEVTLYAPRPDKLEQKLAALTAPLHWTGPQVDVEGQPHLEIIHHGSDQATLIGASWGAESLLTPEDLERRCQSEDFDADFEIIHIAALSTTARQLAFLSYCRKKWPGAKVSAGTYARAVTADGDKVRLLKSDVDIFFMNANEGRLLYPAGRPVHAPRAATGYPIYFITDGEHGATFYGNESQPGRVEAVKLEGEAFDPTGAGDSFCGATLARLGLLKRADWQTLSNAEIAAAAAHGASLAARVLMCAGSDYHCRP